MPYGETWIDEGTDLNVIGYKFTGKELDTETGLYYYGARYLDPQSSRWLSPDPALPQYLPEMQSGSKLPGMGGVFRPVNMQVYHYAANNPVRNVDPSGLWDERIHKGDKNGGTFKWAIDAGFNESQAEIIAKACNNVDSLVSLTNPVFGQEYHFNTNRNKGGASGTPGDSRIQLSEMHLQKAIDYKIQAYTKLIYEGDGYGAKRLMELSLKELGKGLHPLQDVSAHTDDVVEFDVIWHHMGFGTIVDDPAWRPENLKWAQSDTMRYLQKYQDVTMPGVTW